MNKRGVTLIELVIVFAIVAMGAVLVAPNIGAWIPTYRLKSATRDIVSTMRVAQIKAVSNNINYRVSFDPGNKNYVLQYQGSAGLWVNEGVTQALPIGMAIGTTFAGNVANFFPNASATDGSVTLTNAKGSTKTIWLWGTTGRIKSG